MSRKSQVRSWRAGVLVAAAAAGTLSTFTPAVAVVGDPAADGTYAYTARLVIGDNVRACTGVLVDRYWVATAASCFSDDPAQPQALAAGAPKWKTTATIGRTDLTTGAGTVTEVVELAPRQDRDLVLARLAKPVTDIAPIAVATTAPSAGETLRVPGYGRTKAEWITNKLHSGAFSLDTVSPTGIGTTGTGGAAVCKGDTGAPAIRQVNGRAELVAVASRSWQGGCLGVPATETRTGAYSSRVDDLGGWIDQVRGGWWDTVTANPAARSSVYDPVRKISTVFAVDSNHHVVFSTSPDGTTWSGWAQVGGDWEFASVPTALYNPSTGGTELFAIGTDGVLSQTYWMPDGQGWREWYFQDRAPRFTGSPTAVYNPATRTAEVFATRTTGLVAHSYYTQGTKGWSGWTDLRGNGEFVSSPSAVYNPSTGGIELFAINNNGVLKQTYWKSDGQGWRDWYAQDSGWTFSGSPTSAYNPVTQTVEVFATRTSGVVAHAYYTPGMTRWSGWYEIPGRQFAGSPSAVFDPATGGFKLFVVGGDGVLARAEWQPDDKRWRDWTSVGDWKFTAGRFPTVTFNATAGVLDLFATGQNGALNHVTYKADPVPGAWGGWTTIEGRTMITG
ncbi:trypsin-like serine protease [Kitasatospora sp. NPDC058063]|uniref:trypsin-like serine protease n=1 Tax=unclassified Kitasatospora TaxID=2633591 RepID=UPI0036DED442